RCKRFARFWELIANRGNWSETLPLLLQGESAFASFARLAEWLHERSSAPTNIALVKLARWLWQWLLEVREMEPSVVGAAMMRDYERCGRSDWPECLRPFAGAATPKQATSAATVEVTGAATGGV